MMSSAQLWAFLLSHGVRFGEVLGLLLGLGFLIAAGWLALSTLRQQHQPFTFGDVVYPLLGLACGLGSLYSSYGEVRERYLLEPGGGRYTVGSVISHESMRGRPRYTCAYEVASQRYQTPGECGVAQGQDLACPALQTRRFVVFAPEDPSTAQILATPVPDTLRHVPADGWARLP